MGANIDLMPPKKGAKYATDQKRLIATGKKWCPGCDKIKDLDQFHRNRLRANGYESSCKTCRSRAGDREALDLMNRRRFIKRYGITPEQRDQMLEDQSGRCAICPKILTRPCVDHNHQTGAVRGLLCQQCNSVIGMAGDNADTLRSAITYLEEHQ